MRIAAYGFRRHSAYRSAAIAGAFTNTVFGILRAYVLIALWEARPGLAGYDLADAVTFCFLSQAFIGPMQVFGGGLEISDRVRTGDISVDLVRPASLQLWNLSDDLGRAAYLLLLRSLPPTAVGAALFGLIVPSDPATWAFFAASFILAVIVSFGWRYLIALSSCWIIDDRGVQSLSLVMTFFFSGMVLPLNLFPGWLGTLAGALPGRRWCRSPRTSTSASGTSSRRSASRVPGQWRCCSWAPWSRARPAGRSWFRVADDESVPERTPPGVSA
ncbi:ABC transporter permease [Streptosporangium lutulentum]